MTFNSEFPQTHLNEVLSIRAQEFERIDDHHVDVEHHLNEVLSIRAQEFERIVDGAHAPITSMKS